MPAIARSFFIQSCLLVAVAAAGPVLANVDNAALPGPVQVPAGHAMKLWSVGKGEIRYACRERADQAGGYAWAFVAPMATLYDKDMKAIGKYYGGPTWEAADGSKVTGKQLAVAPGSAGSIPLQLVQAEPAMGQGAMTGVSYIQRLNTQGGVPPSAPCDASRAGAEQTVSYQADYVFYGAK
ncbi:DUF3455 domain-containing protein [Azohydromonas australica]|uniref:DUF3455 domain-containing protein n=1 Tax=Azohydromonas australica TaxID=364039 RepID=UPI0003FE01AC|nr:DUF3455 domain-containing protein [Azohydromonas australica]